MISCYLSISGQVLVTIFQSTGFKMFGEKSMEFQNFKIRLMSLAKGRNKGEDQPARTRQITPSPPGTALQSTGRKSLMTLKWVLVFTS